MKLNDFIEIENLKNINKIWTAFWLAIVAIGAYGAIFAIFKGHHHAYNVTDKVPLGLLLSTYVFFVVTSTGLCLVSAIGHVFGVKKLMVFAKRSIFMAIVCMLMGFATIAIELEHPFRLFTWGMISPNFESPILWMGILYSFYLVFMVLEFIFLTAENHKKAHLFGLLGVISAVAAHSNLGAVFGYQLARPFWHGPLMPVYFIMSAMLSGAGLILIIYILPKMLKKEPFSKEEKEGIEALSKIFLFLLFIYIFFEVWKILVGTYGEPPHEFEAIMAFINGPYSTNFWFFEIFLGIVLPVVILLTPKFRTIKGYLFAGLSNLIGIFIIRYDLVVGGEIVPLRLKEVPVTVYRFAEQHLYNPYTPSLYEILIVIGVIGLSVLIYSIADYVLNFKMSGNHGG
jgi:molybdopterin-containing oxidoreductase family membrane subunit